MLHFHIINDGTSCATCHDCKEIWFLVSWITSFVFVQMFNISPVVNVKARIRTDKSFLLSRLLECKSTYPSIPFPPLIQSPSACRWRNQLMVNVSWLIVTSDYVQKSISLAYDDTPLDQLPDNQCGTADRLLDLDNSPGFKYLFSHESH